MTKQAFDSVGVGVRVLPADPFARDFAGHFMQFKGDPEPLLSAHAAIAFDLFCQCRCGVHPLFFIRQVTGPHNSKPSERMNENSPAGNRPECSRRLESPARTVRVHWPSIRCVCLVCGSCSSDHRFAYTFLRTPSHDGHPCCSAGTFAAGCALDFNQLVSAPCRAHE